MKALWLSSRIYVASVAVMLAMLGLIAKYGHYLRSFFPDTSLRSPDVLIVVATVIVAVANVSLVMVTKKYVKITKKSLKLAEIQNKEILALRFKHGLQIGPPHSADPRASDAEVWVANLGVRSFLVHAISVTRHDLLRDYRDPIQTPRTLEPARWDEVIAPGEKKTFELGTEFWEGLKFHDVDVEVRVTVGNGQAESEATEGFFFNVDPSGSRSVVGFHKGFGARWFPLCPKCGTQVGMFQPKGLDSFAEVVANWIEPIQSDFARTCPQHVSDKLQ